MAAAPAASARPIAPVTLSPAITRAPNELTVDVDPAALGVSAQTPSTLALRLPRGMSLDVRSRRRLCSAADAAAATCPQASNIGFGHAVVHVSGYLDPGGEIDIVSSIEAFLGAPQAPGDPASVVFQVQLLGADRLQQALQQNFGVNLRLQTAVTGRLERLKRGSYGLELTVAGLPGGIPLPAAVTGAGVSVTFTRLKLQLGAVRFRRVPFIRRYAIHTLAGPRTLRIHDHRLVAHYLLRNPSVCRRSWPFALTLGFPAGTTTTVAMPVRCVRGRVPLTPPPSPSAPAGA
jgi:hypothetical protein